MKQPSLAAPRYWGSWAGVAVLWLLAQLPLSAACAVGRGIGNLMFQVIRSRRRVVDINLALCFPQYSPEQRAALVKATFRSAGQGILESVWAWFASTRRLSRVPFRMSGIEYLRASDTTGVLLLFPHLTTLEIAGRLTALHTPLSVVYQRASNPVFDRLIAHSRQRYYKQVINRANLRTFLHALQAKETVVYLPDQDFGRENSVFAPFFGVPTATATATARIVERTSVPLIVGSCVRETVDGRLGYSVVFTPITPPFPTGDAVADATAINREVERVALLQPENYFWLHKRF